MRQFAVPIFALVLSATCSNVTSPATIDVVGVYQLQTINGHGLPATLRAFNNYPDTIVDDQLSLKADGTLSEIGHTLVSGWGPPPVLTCYVASYDVCQGNRVGRYDARNGAVTIDVYQDSLDIQTGTLTGNTLTFVEYQDTLVFRR
jgi:hypothetical protein